MSNVIFKFIQRLTTPVPVNAPLAEGDRVDEALNKLQGQINESQEVFVGTPPSEPGRPAIIFEPTIVGGETRYIMKVVVP